MGYTKDNLIEEAIRRLETIEDTLQNAQEFINDAFAERRVVRYLLFLACEERETDKNHLQEEQTS